MSQPLSSLTRIFSTIIKYDNNNNPGPKSLPRCVVESSLHAFSAVFRNTNAYLAVRRRHGTLIEVESDPRIINKFGERLSPSEVEVVLRPFAAAQDIVAFPVGHSQSGQVRLGGGMEWRFVC